MVNIESQRISACQKNVDAQVEFEFIDEKWVFNVTLNNILVPVEDVLDVSSQENSSTLRQSLRFDDVGASLTLLHTFVVVPKLAELQRNRPCFGKEVILLRKVLAHGHESQTKQIFPCEDEYTWKMVNFLMQIHAEECIWLYFSISPPNVPVSRAFILLNNPP